VFDDKYFIILVLNFNTSGWLQSKQKSAGRYYLMFIMFAMGHQPKNVNRYSAYTLVA